MQMIRATKAFAFAVVLVLMCLALILGSNLAGRGAEEDKGLLASLISRALSTPTTRVSIGEVSGALSSDVTIQNVAISDRDGTWLELDRIRLIWRRSALLLGRIEIERLELGDLTVHRRPAASQGPVSSEPIFPELPVKLEVKTFSLSRLTLGAPLLGVDAQLSASGSATVGKPAEGLSLQLDARRLDDAGTLNVRLGYVPATNRLEMTLAVDEPAGGILVRVFKVPDLPPAKLDLNGGGTLDSFSARLALEAGGSIGANGSAQLARQGNARQLTLDLAARIEGLMPAMARPIFSGTVRLNGATTFADDGSITIASVSAASNVARLNIGGSLSSDKVADLNIAVHSLPNAGNKTSAGSVDVRSLTFDATIRGPLMGPRVSVSLAVREANLPQGRFDRLDARFEATPSGSVLGASTSIPVSGRAEATGIEARDPALARAVGSSLTLTLIGTSRDGVTDVESVQVRTQTVAASFVGQIGGPVIKGRAAIEAPNLSRFGGLASLDLRGAMTLRANLDGVPNEERVNITLDGGLSGFESGIAAVDGLAGGVVTLAGTVRMLGNGGYGFRDLRLNGVHASAVIEGEATTETAAIEMLLSVPDLRRADSRLSGRAEAKARMTGTVERPNADASITIADARALGRSVPELSLLIRAGDVTGMIDTRATLRGTIDGKAARGAAHIAKGPGGGWRLDEVDIVIGSVSAQGAVTLDASSLADGRMTVEATDLDDLSPLALTKTAGGLNADVTLRAVDGGQNASLSATGQGLRFGETAINRINAHASVTDAWRRPVIDGELNIDGAVAAGETFSQIRLVARGGAGASEVSFKTQARGFAAEAHGRLVPADNIRFELDSLAARRGSHRLTLANPTVLTLLDDGIDVRRFSLTLGSGSVSVNGRAGSMLDLAVNARAVPLSVANIADPDLVLSGTLDGEARIGGTARAPTGTWRLSIARLTTPQTRDFSLPPFELKTSGRLADRRSTVDATISAPRAGSIRITGSVPLGDDRLDLAAKGRIDLGVANAQLSTAGRRIAGRGDIDLRIGGRIAQPRIEGAARLSNGSFTDAALGTRLTAIAGRVIARGEELVIEQLSAQSSNGGVIRVRGRVRIDPQAGLPGSIEISGQRIQLVSNPLAKVVASPALTLSGPLMRDPRVSGRIDIVSMDITVPERLPTTLRPLPGTRHVAAPAHVLAAQAAARSRSQGGLPGFDASLDLAISAPNRVFVRGRGIDAELGGDLRLTGRLASPTTIGAFDFRRGRLQVVGTRLDFTRGRVSFAGEIIPDLDFLAETRAGEITAQVAVSGPASEPTFTFTSSPELPQDEVLSRILFSKASGGLSPFQALQLAQAAAQFSGAGGSDTFEQMRRSLGVDTLDISTSRSGDPTIGVSRAINERVSVGVKAGASGEDSALTLDIDLTRRLRLQGEAYGNGGTAAGIGMEIEY